MTMQKYALVDVSGLVDNVVVWDGSASWAPPEDHTAIQSDAASVGWTYVNGIFSAPAPQPMQMTLQQAQAAQITALSQACSSAITSGFASSALGSANQYPSGTTDQVNQNTVAQSASGGALWCESGGTWSFKQHTQMQAQAVVASFATWLNKCQAQLVALSEQVTASSSVDSAQTIAWTNPTVA